MMDAVVENTAFPRFRARLLQFPRVVYESICGELKGWVYAESMSAAGCSVSIICNGKERWTLALNIPPSGRLQ